MKLSYQIKDVAKHVPACVRQIVDTFSATHPETKVIDGFGSTIVQVSDAPTWSSGKHAMNRSLGLNTCATLILAIEGEDINVSVIPGAQLDKACLFVIGLVFLPLVFTSIIGFYKQNKLCRHLFDEATRFLIKSKECSSIR